MATKKVKSTAIPTAMPSNDTTPPSPKKDWSKVDPDIYRVFDDKGPTNGAEPLSLADTIALYPDYDLEGLTDLVIRRHNRPELGYHSSGTLREAFFRAYVDESRGRVALVDDNTKRPSEGLIDDFTWGDRQGIMEDMIDESTQKWAGDNLDVIRGYIDWFVSAINQLVDQIYDRIEQARAAGVDMGELSVFDILSREECKALLLEDIKRGVVSLRESSVSKDVMAEVLASRVPVNGGKLIPGVFILGQAYDRRRTWPATVPMIGIRDMAGTSVTDYASKMVFYLISNMLDWCLKMEWHNGFPFPDTEYTYALDPYRRAFQGRPPCSYCAFSLAVIDTDMASSNPAEGVDLLNALLDVERAQVVARDLKSEEEDD